MPWTPDDLDHPETKSPDPLCRPRLSQSAFGRLDGQGRSIWSSLQRFVCILATHRHGILAYYSHCITTGPLEGMNNKIKTMKRQIYDFRDLAFFRLRILAIREMKYALLGRPLLTQGVRDTECAHADSHGRS